MQKKADKMNEDLLSENKESKGLWDSIARCVIRPASVLAHTPLCLLVPVRSFFFFFLMPVQVTGSSSCGVVGRSVGRPVSRPVGRVSDDVS